MTTKEYLDIVHNSIQEFTLPITYDYEEWLKEYSKIKFDLEKRIISHLEAENIPEIKNDALMKIMHRLYVNGLSVGIREWDRDYVRKKYEKQLFGCDVLYYPSIHPKRLVINFSSMSKDRYDRYSRAWDQTEKWDTDTAYLYFKDDNYSYYLGNDNNPLNGVYFKIIKRFMNMNNLSSQQVFTVGGSMGGYAAIYYALALELNGAIVVAPQTTLRATHAHVYRNWEKHIINIGKQWTDLDMMIGRFKKIPNIYIEYGHYRSDVLAVESILCEIKHKKESLIIIRKANWEEHTVDTCLSQKTVESVIFFFENHGFIS